VFLGVGTESSAHGVRVESAVEVPDAKLLRNDPTMAKQFVREASAAASVRHPAVVRLERVGMVGDIPYIAMELLHGEGLEKTLERGALAAEDVLAVATALCAGLEAVHRAGLIHRDLKPSNVFRTEYGEVKLLDLGIAKAVNATTRMTATGIGKGTPGYMAPEQLDGEVDLGVQVDFFALGATLAELALGEPVFVGDTLMSIFRTVSSADAHVVEQSIGSRVDAVCPGLGDVVLHCLKQSPGERPQSAAEIRTAIERISTGAPRAVPLASSPPLSAQITPIVPRRDEAATPKKTRAVPPRDEAATPRKTRPVPRDEAATPEETRPVPQDEPAMPKKTRPVPRPPTSTPTSPATPTAAPEEPPAAMAPSVVETDHAEDKVASQPSPVLRRVGFAMAGILPVAFLGVFGLVGLVSVTWWATTTSEPAIPPAQPREFAWHLDLPAGLKPAAVDELFEQGVEALRASKKREALQDFYRVLQADPTNQSARRFAAATGEMMVLESLGGQLAKTANDRRWQVPCCCSVGFTVKSPHSCASAGGECTGADDPRCR